MKKQIFNPYLPGWEYIPDAEPHVFEHRLYIYGSHDRAGGGDYCLNDYVCWSAPEEDLSDWRYEGVIYRREQHPDPEHNTLFAPDAARGPDGRYYLYYSADNSGIISVAVCDQPAGRYEYLGAVHEPDGRIYGSSAEDWFHFDPAVLVDTDGRIWLYSGSGQKYNEIFGHPVVGCFVTELETDMVTMKGEPKLLLPADESLEKPSFFEGASIRHIGDLYYLVYPATDMTGLNYSTSPYPDRGFTYRGRIHSSSDIGFRGRSLLEPHYPIGNNHGGLVQVNGQWYVFDHRMTNRTFFSRQGVAEPISIREDGSIEMVESTSSGLSGGPLPGKGSYPAYMACVLMGGKPLSLKKLAQMSELDPTQQAMRLFEGPYVTQDAPDYEPSGESGEMPEVYVTGITDGCTIGFKYFDFSQTAEICLTLSGEADGDFLIYLKEGADPIGQIPVMIRSQEQKEVSACLPLTGTKSELVLKWQGNGELKLFRLQFQ